MTEQAKYLCGCGKSYSSYPAYSTHKKQKHANNQIEGTNLPKVYATKRGRPSFSLPPRDKQQDESFYWCLTEIQMSILGFDQKYKNVLSEQQQQVDIDLQQKYQNVERIITSKLGVKLNEFIKKFNAILVYHICQKLSETVTEYLVMINSYLQENLCQNQPILLSWQGEENVSAIKEKVDSTLFNSFFTKRKHMQRLKSLKDIPLELIYEITVLLADFLNKVGITTNKLSLKIK